MENGKLKMGNEREKSNNKDFSASSFPYSVEKVCAACGAQIERGAAKFCRVCGKLLTEDYQPLDRLRASYRLQGKSFGFENARKTEEAETIETENLFDENKNSASETAKAFVVYSLVPYIGILFCPFALLTGGVGVFVSYRKPFLGGRQTSVYSIAFGVIIFAVQILLWWLLYIIPELSRKI